MADTVIIKPDITPEEKLKRLNNLPGLQGLKCQYIGTDKELHNRKPAKKKKAL